MKILKLLNSIYLSIVLIIFFITLNVKAEDKPIDIWNIDKDKIEETQSNADQKILENQNFLNGYFLTIKHELILEYELQ